MVQKQLKVSLAQTLIYSAELPTDTEVNDVRLFDPLLKNLNTVLEYVRKASKEGAEIVVFPEYFLQGILSDGRQYLSLPGDALLEVLSSLAKHYKIAIVGSVIRGNYTTDSAPRFLESSPFKIPDFASEPNAEISLSSDAQKWVQYIAEFRTRFNSDASIIGLDNEAVYIHEDGVISANYAKRNLWHPERDYLRAGRSGSPVFDTKWGKAGFLICWDLSHPAAAQDMIDQGATFIIMPSYWLSIDSEPILSKYNKDPHYEHSVLQALAWSRSFETETVLIMVNAGGPPSEGFMGGSGVWAPLLGKVGGFADSEVGMRTIELDLSVLDDARATYKIRDDAELRARGQA